MKRKILYVSGSRADYGLMRTVLSRIHHHPGFELHIAATGMHVMPEFGDTINEIFKDQFSCHRVNVPYGGDTAADMAMFIGKFIENLIPLIQRIKPDIILVLGDRGEMLGAAITGAYMGIPVAHIHGGEVTATVDELARHAITKLSHIHLPATKKSAERIIRMGEDPKNVHVVGAPGLDQIVSFPVLDPSEIVRKYNLNLAEKIILVIQHPVTLDTEDPSDQMKTTLDAVLEFHAQTIIILPNADAGGRSMINLIRTYEKFPNIQVFPNIDHQDFLSLMRIASVIVGNSSSGIIEAPSFGIPTVNIGSRQKGRERGETIIDCGYNKNEIESAVRMALTDHNFSERLKTAANPYGDGKTAERMVNILQNVEITPGLLQKRMMY
jgi:UDP-hydrolysing UDP-N-acetyl-D-glucosamine 2-epimerase